MWIFLSDSFLSIVDKGGDGSTLLVRARKAGDIERVFPEAKVVEGAWTDYLYRTRIDREVVAGKIADAVRRIDYPNFKATVKEGDRHHAYMETWQAMCSLQDE